MEKEYRESGSSGEKEVFLDEWMFSELAEDRSLNRAAVTAYIFIRERHRLPPGAAIFLPNSRSIGAYRDGILPRQLRRKEVYVYVYRAGGVIMSQMQVCYNLEMKFNSSGVEQNSPIPNGGRIVEKRRVLFLRWAVLKKTSGALTAYALTTTFQASPATYD